MKTQIPSIVDFIPEDGRIKTRELSTLLNMNEREVRHAIQAARLQGVPILADREGYFYSEDPDEIESYCRRVTITINSLNDVKKAVRDVMN